MKSVRNLQVLAAERMNARCVRLRLTDNDTPLPTLLPGQFVEVSAPASASVLLRRPISVNNINKEKNELSLLVQEVGAGTRALAAVTIGSHLSTLLPLGHGFRTEFGIANPRPLLVGGGVGVAPLLFYGTWLREHGVQPTFLLGGRTKEDVLELDEFRAIGEVFVTTDDGSLGERGFVSQHSMLSLRTFSHMAVCGPKPMMQSMVRLARKADIPCEVSLENRMACGLGACLCCVEKSVHGNVCVCTEGPVFNADDLDW